MLLAIFNQGNRIYAVAIAILGAVSNFSTIVTNLQTFLNGLNLPGRFDTVDSQLNAIQGALSNISSQNAQDLLALEQQIAALSRQTGLPQQQGSTVRLPTTPPPGYGGATGSAIGDAVWNYVVAGETRNQGYWLVNAGHFSNQLGTQFFAIPNPADPKFLGFTDWETEQTTVNYINWPQARLENILPTDTLNSWLVRETGFSPWNDQGTGYLWTNGVTGGSDIIFACVIGPQEFAFWKSRLASSNVLVPPVWPGLSGVTLGTPVAISPHFTITGPMAGVIVHLTAVDIKKTTFVADTSVGHRNIGFLVFKDDNGDVDDLQALRWMHEVFVPRKMTQAATVEFNCDTSDVGTVTPFTIP